MRGYSGPRAAAAPLELEPELPLVQLAAAFEREALALRVELDAAGDEAGRAEERLRGLGLGLGLGLRLGLGLGKGALILTLTLTSEGWSAVT